MKKLRNKILGDALWPIFIKMRRDLQQIIEIPEGVEVAIEGNEIAVKGKEGELKRKFDGGNFSIKKKEKQIIIEGKKATKVEKKMMNTIRVHIKNMIVGVQKKFEYVLKIAASHFPMTVEVKKENAVIKNFFGEKIPRKVKIPKNVEVQVDKDKINIKSIDKELAGQAAANFEQATRISTKDRRVFQDGIFIINKAGVEI